MSNFIFVVTTYHLYSTIYICLKDMYILFTNFDLTIGFFAVVKMWTCKN